MDSSTEKTTRKFSLGHKRYRSLDSALPNPYEAQSEGGSYSSESDNPRPIDQLLTGISIRQSLPFGGAVTNTGGEGNLNFIEGVSSREQNIGGSSLPVFGVIGKERGRQRGGTGPPNDLNINVEKLVFGGLRHIFEDNGPTHKRSSSSPDVLPPLLPVESRQDYAGSQSVRGAKKPMRPSVLRGRREGRNGMEGDDMGGNPRTTRNHSAGKSKKLNISVDAHGESDFEIVKRAELIESPNTKSKLNDFFEQFKSKEKAQVSLEEIGKYVLDCLKELPRRNHWHVFLVLADYMKRNNQFKKAVLCHHVVSKLQPYSPQGWLDWAKLEEEHGNTNECLRILYEGMLYCRYDESIAIRCLRFEESQNRLDRMRKLISRFADYPIERSWRVVLEGALVEGRAGNLSKAREVFNHLLGTVKWYGPIYHEVALFEEKQERYEVALKIVLQGLNEIPRYGPLWFMKFRLCEKLGRGGLVATRYTIESSLASISKELLWKVHYEHGLLESRAGNMSNARNAFRDAVLCCSNTHRWKIWLAGSRVELRDGSVELAMKLLNRAMQEVPVKSRSTVYIEYARLEEYLGNIENAREILNSACETFKSEWKIFLAALLLEIRHGKIDLAIEKGWESLKLHGGTGRLWSVLVQLLNGKSEKIQMAVLWQALLRVPKSGEIWCEAARKYLQPSSEKFDLVKARRCLEFAVRFTPQYGDSFVEYLRLEMLEGGSYVDVSHVERKCLNADPNYGAMWTYCRNATLEGAAEVLRNAKRLVADEIAKNARLYQKSLLKSSYSPHSIHLGLPTHQKSVSSSIQDPDEKYYHILDLAMLKFSSLSQKERFKLIFGFDQVGI